MAGRHPDSDLDPCHPQSKALRERWLLEGTPSSASEGDEDMRRQMQEDEQKARLLEESIRRWVGQAVPAPAESREPGPGAHPWAGTGLGRHVALSAVGAGKSPIHRLPWGCRWAVST